MAKPAVADDVGNANDEPQELTLREEIEGARDAYVESVEPAGEEAGKEAAAGGRTRDGNGRFTKGGDNAQAEVSNQPAGGAAQGPAGTVQASGQPQPGAVEGTQPGQETPSGPLIAPNSWSTQAKAEWAALPATIQQEVARREQEIHKTLSRHDEERSLGNQLGQIYQREQEYFQRSQVHPLKLMQDFIGISKILGGPDQNAKAQLLVQAALQNGLNVDALAVMARNMRGGQPPGAASSQGQPGLSNGASSAGLPPEVNQALTEIRQFKEQQDRQAREHEEQQNRTAEAEIMAFRADPSHPHFDAVKDYMVALMANGQAASLKDAYEAACWARPDIRSSLMQSQDAARVASEKARNAAQNARRKGGSIAGGPGGGNSAATPDRSLREELKANMAAALTQRA